MASDASNRNNDVRMCTPRRSMKHSLQKQVKRCALNYELAQAREEFILVSAGALHSLSVEALSVQTLLTLHCMNTARSGIFVGTNTVHGYSTYRIACGMSSRPTGRTHCTRCT